MKGLAQLYKKVHDRKSAALMYREILDYCTLHSDENSPTVANAMVSVLIQLKFKEFDFRD